MSLEFNKPYIINPVDLLPENCPPHCWVCENGNWRCRKCSESMPLEKSSNSNRHAEWWRRDKSALCETKNSRRAPQKEDRDGQAGGAGGGAVV